MFDLFYFFIIMVTKMCAHHVEKIRTKLQSIYLARGRFRENDAKIAKFLTLINPSSPKGGCTNPPNGFRPGAQNRTAKG